MMTTEMRQEREAGFTLTELIVSMSIFLVVLTVFISGLISMSRATMRAQDVTDAGDSVRAAFQTMDKQVRYASSINFPGTGTSGSYYVEFITEAQPDGQDPLCTQWRYDPTARTLAYRKWRDVSGGTVSPWLNVASDVRNTLGGASPNPPFTLVRAGASYVRQELVVSVDAGRGAEGANAVIGADIGTVFVARNSSASSQSNADTNSDNVSDTPVCTSHLERP